MANNRAFRWYAVVNDLIGGWCIHTADVPCSELRYLDHDDHREIATFTSQADAEYIAALHNERLGAGL